MLDRTYIGKEAADDEAVAWAWDGPAARAPVLGRRGWALVLLLGLILPAGLLAWDGLPRPSEWTSAWRAAWLAAFAGPAGPAAGDPGRAALVGAGWAARSTPAVATGGPCPRRGRPGRPSGTSTTSRHGTTRTPSRPAFRSSSG